MGVLDVIMSVDTIDQMGSPLELKEFRSSHARNESSHPAPTVEDEVLLEVLHRWYIFELLVDKLNSKPMGDAVTWLLDNFGFEFVVHEFGRLRWVDDVL